MSVIPNFLLGLIPGRGTVYLLLMITVLSFVSGFYVKGKFEDAKLVMAVNEARAQERDAALIGNESDRKYLSTLRQREKDANVKLNALRRRLASVPACPVPVTPGLRDGFDVPATAPDARRARPAGEGVDSSPVADARDVVLTCERNRLEVHEPNAEQIKAMREWYRGIRERLNQ